MRDCDEAIEAWLQASRVAHAFLSEEFLDEERDRLAGEWLPGGETWVYELDGMVVGFVSMVGDEVGGLFVRPDQQRRGVGRALLDHVRATRDTLEVCVFEANDQGRAFYDAYGFGIVDRGVDEVEGHQQLRLRLVGVEGRGGH